MIHFPRPLNVLFFTLFSLPFAGFEALALPPQKKIDSRAVVESLFLKRTNQVNELNDRIKKERGVSPEEEKALRSTYTPISMTADQSRAEDAAAAKDPDEKNSKNDSELEDDEIDKNTASSESSKAKRGSSGPSVSFPSGQSGKVTPGHADPEMIVYPGPSDQK